jgi:hypothetical protein
MTNNMTDADTLVHIGNWLKYRKPSSRTEKLESVEQVIEIEADSDSNSNDDNSEYLESVHFS